jgi:pilus assembly protein CpaB
MSDESSPTGHCSRCPLSRSGLIGVLLVLLAITTTGWVVTATRDRPAPAPVRNLPLPRHPRFLPPGEPEPGTETVEVLVAAKNLPEGTTFTLENLKDDQLVKTRKVAKNDVPPPAITNRDELVERALRRPIQAEETFERVDLSPGNRSGLEMVSLPVGVLGSGGYVGPGSRVDILATVRRGKKLYAFPLLINIGVLAVDTPTVDNNKGIFPLPTVTFAATETQALLVSLAKDHGCHLDLRSRNPSRPPESDKDYDIKKVIKMLSDETGAEPVEVAPPPHPVGEPR